MSTNITDLHKEQFEAIKHANNIALMSCFVDGEPAVAITVVNKDYNGYTVTPLFVSITPKMVIKDHDDIETSKVV